MNRLQLWMGDPDFDRPGERRWIATELSGRELEAAYAAGSKLVGVDIINGRALDQASLSKIRAANPPEELVEELGAGEMSTDAYVALWLWIAQKGNPAFSYEWCESSTVWIGGYELFQ